MKIAFYVMVIQRKSGKTQLESKITRQFITALRNPFQLIVDSSRPKTRYHYTPYMLPDVIYFASGNYYITLDSPYDSPQDIIFICYSNRNYHTITRDKTGHPMENTG